MQSRRFLWTAGVLAALSLIGSSSFARVGTSPAAAQQTRIWQVQHVLARDTAVALAQLHAAVDTTYSVYLSLDGTKENGRYLFGGYVPEYATKALQHKRRVQVAWGPIWLPDLPRKVYVCTESDKPLKFALTPW